MAPAVQVFLLYLKDMLGGFGFFLAVTAQDIRILKHLNGTNPTSEDTH